MIVADEVWKTYRHELHRFVASRVGSSDVSEDLVHEVLVRAYTRHDQLSDPGKLRAWLYSITRNVIIDYYRAQRPLDPLPDDLSDAADENAPTAEQQLANCLEPLIRQLPEEYAEALLLSDIDGVPQASVAEKSGLSVSGAKSRIQRARVMLREAVLECCRLEFDNQGRVADYERHDAAARSSCASSPARKDKSRTGRSRKQP